MGEKRKAGGKPTEEPNMGNNSDSKLVINTYEDVADSEDEFHINRDKILLDDGPARKRQRKLEEDSMLLRAFSTDLRLMEHRRRTSGFLR